MYHWVEDKDFLKRSYSLCADIVNQLVQNLKKYDIEASMNAVGSKKRNMVTQNGKEDIDFDFNLLIRNPDDDVCIVKMDLNGHVQRLIHNKAENTLFDSWYWNTVRNSCDLWEKEDKLKPHYWKYVRQAYIDKKNIYLKRPYDHGHPSFICYIEAVNEIYDKEYNRILKKR